MYTRRSKSEREGDNLKKDIGEGKKQGGLEELRSSQSVSMENGVLVGKRDGLMRLLARRDMMMMMMMMINGAFSVRDVMTI